MGLLRGNPFFILNEPAGFMKSRKTKDVILSMFLSVALAMILTQVMGVAAFIIDGIITSRALGAEAYSAVSLIGPLISTFGLFATFISTGCQIVSSEFTGKGKKEAANSTFTFSIIVSLLMSAVLVLACLLIPNTLMTLCGVSGKYPELRPMMTDYLHGYLFSVPFFFLIQLCGPIIVMDGGKRRFTISSIVFCIVNIASDLAAAFVFKAGLYGMGLASSFAYFVQFVILLIHFFRKTCTIRLTHRHLSRKSVGEVFKSGSPAFVRKAFTVLRDLFTNYINIAVAISAAAIAARGIQHDLNLLMFCTGIGLGRAILSMTGIYYSANDRQGLRMLFIYAMKTSGTFSAAVGFAAFVFAPLISRIYTSDPEVLSLSVYSIRVMALSLPLDTLATTYTSYLQGVNSRKMVNVLNFFDRFLIPVVAAFVMGQFFGTKGVLASLAVCKLILVLVLFVIVWLHAKRFPRDAEDYMYLSKRFGGKKTDNLYASIITLEDVIRERGKAEQFCLAHGTSKKDALHTALFIEEMAGNIVEHGEMKEKAVSSIDYRLSVIRGKITLTIRDYRARFDPILYLDENHRNPEKVMGISIVKNLAKDVRYFNAFNSNNIIISIH